jgi:hypothetical protein
MFKFAYESLGKCPSPPPPSSHLSPPPPSTPPLRPSIFFYTSSTKTRCAAFLRMCGGGWCSIETRERGGIADGCTCGIGSNVRNPPEPRPRVFSLTLYKFSPTHGHPVSSTPDLEAAHFTLPTSLCPCWTRRCNCCHPGPLRAPPPLRRRRRRPLRHSPSPLPHSPSLAISSPLPPWLSRLLSHPHTLRPPPPFCPRLPPRLTPPLSHHRNVQQHLMSTQI